MRVIEVSSQYELKALMQDIKVDPYGIRIMTPKGMTRLIKLTSVSNITANILKQEMLSLGGDVALARGALTGKAKKTDCLLMGNISQLNRLNEKLKRQPFGLNRLAADLSCALLNYEKDKFTVDLGRHKLHLGRRPYIMGILNLTPDSFSGDGIYKNKELITKNVDYAIEYAEDLVKDGADIIDIGGESTRPGASPVSVKEELRRVIPAIKLLSKRVEVPLSVDTYKPQVARAALDNGAVIVNDISGLSNPLMRKLTARFNAGVVVMHMKGRPSTMQDNPEYDSLIDDIIEFLNRAVSVAVEEGVRRDKIIIDPGIGFGKTMQHNLQILKRLREFKVLGRPILIGPSRKSFIGKVLNAGPEGRLLGSLAACIMAVKHSAHIVRVHDVKEVKQALKIAEAIDSI